ncbi:glycosyltransferase family 49 protein [Desarmillaria tabescens]|uniref:Glycosyltransferase family 49 protein n=1 Tax=Armillaria tabescens TaxID=1929756 RepID=A0AA39TJ80_ARMTA|nr:glycosyltransferase family 49 protein [Desarmillaria tabescens]KAK0460917.1 glycosyltransferase family 49 protein [Desarmillaria tabescens]
MDEDLFLSKAFSSSLHPSKIVPFFYRASGRFDREDITITTIITSNRFQVFARLVERYRGPISVTIHVNNDTTHILDLLDSLETLYTSSPQMSRFVDVHLVVDFFDRQFNTWRNIARLFARTDFVMMLDIDFYLCTDFRSAIRNSRSIMAKLKEGRAALALKSLIETKQIDMFHASWAPGHNSTDYGRFYAASPGEVYQVTQYQAAYEPYVIFKADGPPWCDERFVGYGGNKAACLYEMYLSGISFYVLADHFLIHQSHAYEEAIRKNERKFNRKIYSDFKEEACLK